MMTCDICSSYSYMMLIEPASNVSVPLTVVRRTRSNAPERVTFQAPHKDLFASVNAYWKLAAHIFPDILVKINRPTLKEAAVPPSLTKPNPVVLFVTVLKVVPVIPVPIEL